MHFGVWAPCFVFLLLGFLLPMLFPLALIIPLVILFVLKRPHHGYEVFQALDFFLEHLL